MRKIFYVSAAVFEIQNNAYKILYILKEFNFNLLLIFNVYIFKGRILIPYFRTFRLTRTY